MAKDQVDAPTDEQEDSAAGPAYRVISLDKRDTSGGAPVVSNVFEPEDEYKNMYLGQEKSINAIRPPYDLKTLDRLSQENNSLNPCIEAMVTNVDGTGFDLMKDAPGADKDDGQNDDPQVKEMWDFFNEPWPGESFVTQRKQARRDMHRTGNGYLEVIRNAADEIMFSRHADSKMMRLLKLDDPRSESVTVRRKGRDVTLSLKKRYRRFVQIVNGVQLRYFKEFGCPLDLNKTTGQWAPAGQRLGVQQRATEIIHFVDLPDAHTPYGVPRWISQLPSVLGSRKAEEFNLEFFDNGGVPPVLIILQGGVLAHESRRALEMKTGGAAKTKNRVQVLEMEPSGGSIDNPGTAKVTVERFGAERQNDSMFEKYDEKCEIRVRRAFRLPPIFIGQAGDYSFATAYASYTVAEAQVFMPERQEFDEIMTVKFLPAMGYAGYKMVSRPMTISDSTIRLTGIGVAAETGYVPAKEVVDAVNEATGMALQVSSEPQKLEYTHIPKAAIQAAQTGSKGASGDTDPSTITQEGKTQSNSTDKTPTSTPVKPPAVTKEDTDVWVSRMITAMTERDHDELVKCYDGLRDLPVEEQVEFAHLLSDTLHTTDVSAA